MSEPTTASFRADFFGRPQRLGVLMTFHYRPRKIQERDRQPFGVMRVSDNLKRPFAFTSRAMPTRNPTPLSNRPASESLEAQGKGIPETRESSIEYVGRKEPRVPLPILFLGFAAIAAAIIAFVRLSRP